MKTYSFIWKTFTAVTMFLFSIGLAAQSDEGMVQFVGKVIDSKTGAAVPYASITLSESSISNVTNTEGEFTLKVPSEYAKLREITISHLGYSKATVATNKFGTKRLTIELTPVNLKIDAAVIKSNQALDLLQQAYERQEINFPQVTMGLTSFYREIIRKGSSKYLSFNEAIIDINKAPYSGVRSDKAGIFKSRGSMNYSINDSLLVNFQGGVVSSLQIDLVKHPFAGVDYSQMADVYDFSMGESKFMDDRAFLVVKFDQKENVKQPFFRGCIYIDSESYAIGRIEMQMNVEGNPEATNIFFKRKPSDRDMEVESASYIVNYKKIGELWYYDYSQIDIRITEKMKKSVFKNHYQIVSEMAVTDRSLKEKKIDNTNRIRFADVLSKKVSDFTDENFWEDYNTIEPDKSMDVIIKKIIRQLKKHSLD